MPLFAGTRLGHYDVSALIGEGGMGQVWQATDTKLNRQVALKIFPDAFAADPERLARFTREAQILASLNHPKIAAIHGIEEAEGTRALVLELVEGATLADRIKQGPIPIDEALPIARQIAAALEAAHEQGVIHRDLKPANIKVKADGTVKVLDFGLARALQPDPASGDASQSPTLTAAATQAGVIHGDRRPYGP
jgi:serine/threonine protein kinase